MEQGTIAAWKVDEGGAFGAGDVIAEIETDKATVDFEAQDDGVLAKILVPAGTEVATAPHYLTMDCDVGAAGAPRVAQRAAGDAAPVGLYDLMIKASASATKAVPAVNASWLEPGVVRQYARFDVNAARALALGAVRDDVALGDDGALIAKPTLTCTLAADHRVVDGAVGAQWLAALKGLVENPTTLLL
ncbi:dihydrolipoyllysine-residue acetyltransferase [Aureococcus anophagefferens]|nr:dihydrolipoyllysine-residue acetyltransferase [Aureococcus anophagefferens]